LGIGLHCEQIAEEQFARVDAQYSSSEDTQLLRLGGIEDRILSLQRQMEERSRTQLDMAVCDFFIFFGY